MSSPAPAPALQRAPGVVDSAVGDDVLVLAPGAEQVLRLEGTARAVWELLAAPATEEELAVELAEAYAAPLAQVRADLQPLLRDLQDRGVLLAGA